MTPSAQKRRRQNRFASSPESGSDIPLWRRGLSFLLILGITSLLVVFVLYMQHRWRLRGQRAIVVVHQAEDEIRKPLSVIVYEPEQTQVTVLSVSREQQLPLWASPAQYAADALVGYIQLESLDWQFLQFQLFLEYGVVVDGVVWSSLSPTQLQEARGVEKLAWRFLQPRMESTLTYYDRWLWWSWTHRISSPNFAVTTPRIQDETKLLDQNTYDRWANSRVQDPQIRRSRWSIAILNASEKQGQAQRLARVLRLLGYEVRQVDTVATQPNSELILAPMENTTQETSWARQRLSDIFGWSVREDAEVTAQRRSDAVIIIGQDQ